MPNSLNTFKPRIFSRNKSITNFNYTSADTEQEFSLVDNLNQLLVKARGFDLRVAFVSGGTLSAYVTIPAGSSLFLQGMDLSSSSLFLRASTTGTIEILQLYAN